MLHTAPLQQGVNPLQAAPEPAHAVHVVHAVEPGLQRSPHWPEMPPPPQVSGAVHVPQLMMPTPQPSPIWPHWTFCAWQLVGAQDMVMSLPPQRLGPPPPQNCGVEHEPQFAVSPVQPSLIWPHRAG
jgi:hypothetical protein